MKKSKFYIKSLVSIFSMCMGLYLLTKALGGVSIQLGDELSKVFLASIFFSAVFSVVTTFIYSVNTEDKDL